MFNYENGMQKVLEEDMTPALKERFEKEFEALRSVLKKEGLYGSTSITRAKKYEIVGNLKRLCLQFLPLTFNEYCMLN